MNAPDYLNPDIPGDLVTVQIPLVRATAATLSGYGLLVDDPGLFDIEIVTWPAAGWRPVDDDTGNQGGVKEGTFISYWKGDIIYGKNTAVDGHYILGYSKDPAQADESSTDLPEKLLMWHANYHPDGGQLFFPLDNKPFVIPLAKPGDDIRPEDFVSFWCDGSQGVYIHPNIWHEGVLSISGQQRFLDRQGAVHARVSVDFAREFNCLLESKLNLSV